MSETMEIKALNVPNLTHEVAHRLETSLGERPGVELLNILLDSQELYISFNERVLNLPTLARIMAEAGCPLRNISAVFVK
jgi:hypothetical protein